VEAINRELVMVDLLAKQLQSDQPPANYEATASKIMAGAKYGPKIKENATKIKCLC